MAKKDNGGGFTVGFLTGGIIGVVIGILIAPKPGAQTRSELAEQSEAWRSRAEELAATVRDKSGPAIDNIRDRISKLEEEG